MIPERIVQDPMNAPVGALAVRVEPVHLEDSLQGCGTQMRDYGVPVLPVVREDRLVGAIGEGEIHHALAQALSPKASVETVLNRTPATISPYATGAEALRKMEGTGSDFLIVVDDADHPLGVLMPSGLVPGHRVSNSHRPVGGMATPFGVYLTNGVVSGGASASALVLTGVLMFGLFWVFATLVNVLFLVGPVASGLNGLGNENTELLRSALSVAGFLALLRVIPLAGTHAAEHQTVHAIERGEPLHPDVVSRMPRVHPRCGTNLAAGLMVFTGLLGADWIPYFELRLVLAGVAALILWKPIGGFLQKYVTTKPATRPQILSGIRAGSELLERSYSAPYAKPNVFRRLMKSGIFHIVAGAILVQLGLWALGEVLNLPPNLRVI